MARRTAGNKKLCIIQDARMNFVPLNQKQEHPLVSLAFLPASFQLPWNFSKIGRGGHRWVVPWVFEFSLSEESGCAPFYHTYGLSRCLKEEVEGFQVGGNLFQFCLGSHRILG